MNISTKLAAGIRPSTMSSSRRLRRLFYGINSTRASHSHMPRYCYFIGDTWVVWVSVEGGRTCNDVHVTLLCVEEKCRQEFGLIEWRKFFPHSFGRSVCGMHIFLL